MMAALPVMGALTIDAAETTKDRPNILWLTMEDSSAYEFGCYGNPHVKTPNIDALAQKGVRFTNASSIAPQCSPARSTLISGAYATTYGTGFHRRKYETPGKQYFYTPLFKDAGYLCLNPRKMDYNTPGGKGMWHEGDKYEKTDKPFLAVFNNGDSHMTSVHKEKLPESDIDISHLPYLPDLPQIRANYDKHLRAVEKVDKWVGRELKRLEKSGKADDTIIFFYSDHGGCQPRGKAYPFETGLRVPLIVYVPPKWQHLSPDLKMGTVSDRLVGFVDFAPTILSLAGIKPPDYMQGKAFMGPYAQPPRQYQFGFRTNQGVHYDPVRTVTDGRYKYMRNYIPFKPFGVRQAYQWVMGANQEYDQAHLQGKLKPVHARHFQPKPPEFLFDLEKDPFELNNLAGDPAHQETLATLREEVSRHIRETKDLGFFPPETREHGKQALYDWVRENDYPLAELHDLAERASDGKPEDAPRFAKALESGHPAIRFWGATGFSSIANRGRKVDVPDKLTQLTEDKNPDVAAAAAEALCYLGQQEEGTLVKLIQENNLYACSALEVLVKNKGLTEGLKPHLPELKAMATGDEKINTGGRLFYIRSILVDCGINTPFDLYDDSAWTQLSPAAN